MQHFNRIARGLLLILVVQFQLLATHYFDDFSVLELDRISGRTEKFVVAFFDLLGWDLKAHHPFSSAFAPPRSRD